MVHSIVTCNLDCKSKKKIVLTEAESQPSFLDILDIYHPKDTCVLPYEAQKSSRLASLRISLTPLPVKSYNLIVYDII